MSSANLLSCNWRTYSFSRTEYAVIETKFWSFLGINISTVWYHADVSHRPCMYIVELVIYWGIFGTVHWIEFIIKDTDFKTEHCLLCWIPCGKGIARAWEGNPDTLIFALGQTERRLGKQMSLFAVYQPRRAQEESLWARRHFFFFFFINGPETQRGCVLFTAASSSRVMLSWLQQKTLKPVCKSRRPPPLHVCQQKPIVAAINTYKYWLNKRAFASVCAESVKVHSVPGKFLLHCLILKE